MKSLKTLMAIIVMLSVTTSYSQIKNIKTESVKIYGNCEMCKATIEKAGNVKNSAKVDWNEETKMASIKYNSKLTNRDAVLKRIALAGYDSDSFLAPDLAYSKLMDCCKYERKSKIMPVSNVILAENKIKMPKENEHAGHNMPMEAKAETAKMDEHADYNMSSESRVVENVSTSSKMEISPIKAVFNEYFKVKDALVNTDVEAASSKAFDLVKSLNALKMNELENDVHLVWMKVMKDLGTDAKKIANSKKIDYQRNIFIPLTKNIYALMKVAKTESPTYYQFCPMANDGKGANWLSQEKEIRNPYFGSEMMNCGKVLETIN